MTSEDSETTLEFYKKLKGSTLLKAMEPKIQRIASEYDVICFKISYHLSSGL